MTLKKIDTLIIDLDNTIFDWFANWYASFDPIYQEIVAVSTNSVAEVEEDIRRVHQYHRTSEYSFLIEELEVLENIDEKGGRREQFREAIQKSRLGRDNNMQLYDGVFKSLWDIKNKGTKIIAYTESMAFYSSYRLKRFGLDGVIDVLYSPQDHIIPYGTSLHELRRLPDDFYQLQVTETKNTPLGELKPNPKILLDIIKAEAASIDRCIYVGDSLFKDVAMARDIAVLDVHAKYGESQKRPEYELLRRVSHWTEEDVKREKEIIEQGHEFEPSIVLKESFCEIFMHCEFQPFFDARNEAQNISNNLALETWKKTVDVQQHFNDLQLRLRNYAILIIGAMTAAIGFTFQLDLQTTIFDKTFPTGIMLVIASIFAWFAFYIFDYGYHALLKGAVDHAGKIEKEYDGKIPGISLGATISEVSKDVKYLGIFKMNSTLRLNTFYIIGGMMLGALLLGFLFSDKNGIQKEEPISSQTPPINNSQQKSK